MKEIFTLNTLLISLFIFFIKILDVSLTTLRINFLMRGKKALVFITAFIEVIIFLIALNFVLKDILNPLKLIAYALGFSFGGIIGLTIEEKLAVGMQTFLVIPSEEASNCAYLLREKGFGVTCLNGSGKEGKKQILLITTLRRNRKKLESVLDKYAPGSFVTVLDTRHATSGSLYPNNRA